MKRKIVIIDSDKPTLRIIENVLTAGGYEIFSSVNISEGLALIASECPDIVILDPEYPERTGVRMIGSLREWSACPVICVSHSVSQKAIIEILDAGADDFMPKPIAPGELLARIRVCLRRIEAAEAQKGAVTISRYEHSGLIVDLEKHSVILDGNAVHLTKNEFKILSLLCRYCGRVLTYEFILKSVWGPRTTTNNGILRVNITNIRRKIERDISNPQFLLTENCIGYRIAEGNLFKS